MLRLQKVLLVLSLITLSLQLVHYSYKKFHFPAVSVLDSSVDKKIRQATSLQELLDKREKSKQAIKDFEASKSKEELRRINKYSGEPYATKIKLELAISDWEKREREKNKMFFYWFAGLVLVIIGAVLYYFKQIWFGISLVIAGMLEQVWWSSPSFSNRGAAIEIARLLNAKILLTLISILLIVLLWYFRNKKASSK